MSFERYCIVRAKIWYTVIVIRGALVIDKALIPESYIATILLKWGSVELKSDDKYN